ncbi:MAG: cyclic nucleotide-binding domain-containing protein [Rhizobiales bacterium]|nr:cyclic nucleotide-binding domain-containing protein [Hyphomicrobiales bacterium]
MFGWRLFSSSGWQDHGLQAVFQRLPLFRDLSRKTLNELTDELTWFSLPAGEPLFHQGARGDALFVLVSGMLALTVTDHRGETRRIGYIHAGETVGELALMSGEPRTATVTALRDSTLFGLDQGAFQRLIDRHPHTSSQLLRMLAERQVRMHGLAALSRHAGTIALISLDAELSSESLGHRLAARLDALNPPAGGRLATKVLGADAIEITEDRLHELETIHARLIYCAQLYDRQRMLDPSWARRCHRQADYVFALARPTTYLPARVVNELIKRREEPRPHDLVVIHPAHADIPAMPKSSVLKLPADLQINLKGDGNSEIDRLARLVAGKANGLVLAGGGARGYSHIGVIKALHEAGMPIDLVGGSSIGSIIAAGLAVGWSVDELYANIKEAFVDSNPVNDYTLPFVALTRGDKVTRRLKRFFGDITFEQTWRPFYCVSSNLTKGDIELHQHGALWRSLRASVSIPGILPPMIENGQVLVDGAVMNNFPTDIMRDFGRGPVVGVDVGQVEALVCNIPDYSLYPRWRALLRLGTGAPGIGTLLVRAATVSSEAYARSCREQADLLFTPPVEQIELRAWKTLDYCIECGYRHAMEVLERLEKPWW